MDLRRNTEPVGDETFSVLLQHGLIYQNGIRTLLGMDYIYDRCYRRDLKSLSKHPKLPIIHDLMGLLPYVHFNSISVRVTDGADPMFCYEEGYPFARASHRFIWESEVDSSASIKDDYALSHAYWSLSPSVRRNKTYEYLIDDSYMKDLMESIQRFSISS